LVNPKFGYNEQSNPRRVLTKPSERADNQGYDNKDHDYILYVHDIISGPRAPNRYQVLDLLGKGTFGQVVKCLDLETNDYVAVKIVKNLPAFHSQGLVEVKLLQTLNAKYDSDIFPMVRMLDNFIFRNHLCLVFELLNVSLYELIRQNQFRGLSVQLVSIFTKQILTAMVALHQSRIIHCDLKPENILLEDASSPNLKVIDFGSACFDNQAVYTYIQSRFYRSPEVILGLPYKMSIDIWSLGCIVFELFVGLPLFPGLSQHRMLMRFIKFLGMPPYRMLIDAKDTSKFFNRTGHTGTIADYTLKTDEEYSRHIAALTGNKPVPAQPFRDYYKAGTIQQIVLGYEYKSGLSKADREEETAMRKSMLSFLDCVLPWEPEARWTPEELLTHPFITGQPCPSGALPRPAKAVCNQYNPLLAHMNAPLTGAAGAPGGGTGGLTTPTGTTLAMLTGGQQLSTPSSSREMDEDDDDMATSDQLSYVTGETRSASSTSTSTSGSNPHSHGSHLMQQDAGSTASSISASSQDRSGGQLHQTSSAGGQQPLRYSTSSLTYTSSPSSYQGGAAGGTSGMRSGTTGSSSFLMSPHQAITGGTAHPSGHHTGHYTHGGSGTLYSHHHGHGTMQATHTGSIPAMSLASGFGSAGLSGSGSSSSMSYNSNARAMSGPLLTQQKPPPGNGKVPALPGLGSSPSTSHSYMSGQSPFYAKLGLSPRGSNAHETSSLLAPLNSTGEHHLGLGSPSSGNDLGMAIDEAEMLTSSSSISTPAHTMIELSQHGLGEANNSAGYRQVGNTTTGSGKRAHSKSGSVGGASSTTDLTSISPRSGSSPKRHKHASVGSSSSSSPRHQAAGRRHSGAQPLNPNAFASPSQMPLIPIDYAQYGDEASVSLMEMSTPTQAVTGGWQEPLLGLDSSSFSPVGAPSQHHGFVHYPGSAASGSAAPATGSGQVDYAAMSALEAANNAQFQRARFAGTDMMVDLNYMGGAALTGVGGQVPGQSSTLFPSSSYGSVPHLGAHNAAQAHQGAQQRGNGLASSAGAALGSGHLVHSHPPTLSSASQSQPPIPTMFTAYATSQAANASHAHPIMPSGGAFANLHASHTAHAAHLNAQGQAQAQHAHAQQAPGSFGKVPLDGSGSLMVGELDDSLAFTWDHPSGQPGVGTVHGTAHGTTLAQSGFSAALASPTGPNNPVSSGFGRTAHSQAPGSGQYGNYGMAAPGSNNLAVPGTSYGSTGSNFAPSNFGLGVSPYDPTGHHFFSGSFSSSSSFAQPALGSSMSSTGQSSHWGGFDASSSYGSSYDAPNNAYAGYSFQSGLPALSSSFLVSPSSDPNSFMKRAAQNQQQPGSGIIPSKQNALSSSPTSRTFRRHQDTMQ
jgi:serine/threonine protein kinase